MPREKCSLLCGNPHPPPCALQVKAVVMTKEGLATFLQQNPLAQVSAAGQDDGGAGWGEVSLLL